MNQLYNSYKNKNILGLGGGGHLLWFCAGLSHGINKALWLFGFVSLLSTPLNRSHFFKCGACRVQKVHLHPLLALLYEVTFQTCSVENTPHLQSGKLPDHRGHQHHRYSSSQEENKTKNRVDSRDSPQGVCLAFLLSVPSINIWPKHIYSNAWWGHLSGSIG